MSDHEHILRGLVGHGETGSFLRHAYVIERVCLMAVRSTELGLSRPFFQERGLDQLIEYAAVLRKSVSLIRRPY